MSAPAQQTSHQFDSHAHVPLSRYLIGPLCAVAVLASAVLLFKQRVSVEGSAAVIVITVLLELLFMPIFLHPPMLERRLQIVATLLFLIVALNAYSPFFDLKSYGDGDYLRHAMMDGALQPRWLGGTFLLNVCFDFYNKHVRAVDPIRFIETIGAATMLTGSLFALRRLPESSPLFFVLISPLWIAFSLGYLEYYPFIAPLLLISLVWLAQECSALLSGALIAALLPWFYIGFAPIACVILMAAVLRAPRRAALAVGLAAAIYNLLVMVTWPGGMVAYLPALQNEMNLGAMNIFKPYRNMIMGENSIFFAFDAILDPRHLRHMWFMYFYSAGLATLPLLLFIAYKWFRRPPRIVARIFPYVHLPLLLLAAWSIFYFVFMIPRLGPRRDIDLFFGSLITLHFFCGWALIQLHESGGEERARLYRALVPIWLGTVVPGAYFLAIAGIPAP